MNTVGIKLTRLYPGYKDMPVVVGSMAVSPQFDNLRGAGSLGSIEEQTERTLRNVEAILLAAGSDFAHVLKMTIYVADIELWGAVNATYAKILGAHKPARAIVPTKDLHHGFLVEIDAIAAVRA